MSPKLAILCAALGAAVTTPDTALAQPAGRAEFRPHSGYLRTVKRNRAIRLMAPGPGVSDTVLSGTRAVPVICVSFRNRAPAFSAAAYQSLLFDEQAAEGPAPLSLTQYYSDMSGGKFKVTGRVFGWYELPNDDTYYENAANGDGTPFGELLATGLMKADAEVNFGQFDNDGPDGLPNSGDDDGEVDTVIFIHSETGGECSRGNPNIWSHSWHYNYARYGHTTPYITDDVRLGSDGKPILNPDGTPAHIVVDDYTIQPGVACPEGSAEAPPEIIGVGVFCHEYGHALGLPDLYDRTPETGADSEGVGAFCVMAAGAYGGDGRSHPKQPTAMSAWCRQFLGWASVTRVIAPGPATLAPLFQSGTALRIDLPGNAAEYFLLEYRSKELATVPGSVFKVNWDSGLPSAGLAIWHVDESVGSGSPDWPMAPAGAGQNDTPSRQGVDGHALVCLIQADGREDLENARNRGDAEDLWGADAEFGPRVPGGSRSYAGVDHGIVVNHIDLETGSLQVALGAVTPEPAPPAAPTPAGPAVALGGEAGARNGAPPRQPARDRDRDRRLAGIASKVKLKDHQPLSADERDLLRNTTQSNIKEAAPEAEDAQSLRVAVADLRTQSFTPETKAVTKAERDMVELVKASRPGYQNATAQFAPGLNRVEKITGLKVQPESQDLDREAGARLDQIRPLLGEQLQFAPAQRDAKAPNQRKYQQTIAVDGKELPVFGAHAVLYFDEQKNLAAVQSTAVPGGEIKVTDGAPTKSADQVQEQVQKQLAIPKGSDRKPAVQEGVYLVGQDPAKARRAYEVRIPAGEGQEDIVLYLDSATQQVLGSK